MNRAASWRHVTQNLGSGLRSRGLDLVHPFRVSWYDDAVAREDRLPWAGGGESLALLVGNTRAFWSTFLQEMEREPDRPDVSDPLDRWMERTLVEETRSLDLGHEVVFSHEPPPRRLPMQRLAMHVGFAPLSAGQLLAHPEYGPWFALRAVVIVDVAGPDGPAPTVGPPCEGCDAPCGPAFEHACEVGDARTDHALLGERWRPWLAVRDACPVGRAHRYSDAQIRFHYAREWPTG
ncbi:MAG: hypothetical protein P8R42_14075 [Candidatus Binatia bacterium]|nr:hypothetical protein [Candidatus Binatia bacterium]